MKEGTPQGGVISPLLANICLNPLDHLMSHSGYEMVRYADDMVILCHSAEAAETAMAALREWSAQAGLELHPQKTRIVDIGQPKAHFSAGVLVELDGWTRMRLRSILRTRAAKGRGLDHHRWPDSYFTSIGLFNLEEAQKLELMSLRVAANF
ncbi:MAG: reverse transcriptase domain-containing protein [Prosthecobacter sp.]